MRDDIKKKTEKADGTKNDDDKCDSFFFSNTANRIVAFRARFFSSLPFACFSHRRFVTPDRRPFIRVLLVRPSGSARRRRRRRRRLRRPGPPCWRWTPSSVRRYACRTSRTPPSVYSTRHGRARDATRHDTTTRRGPSRRRFVACEMGAKASTANGGGGGDDGGGGGGGGGHGDRSYGASTVGGPDSVHAAAATGSPGFSILRSLPSSVANDRQRARSLSSVPDDANSDPTAVPRFDVTDVLEADSSSNDDRNVDGPTVTANISLGRVYSAHSLPAHIWSFNGMRNLCVRRRYRFRHRTGPLRIYRVDPRVCQASETSPPRAPPKELDASYFLFR